MPRQSYKPNTVVQKSCDERDQIVGDFFALLFRVDQRIKKSKETVCSTPSAKSK
jgi:hypothetical protein